MKSRIAINSAGNKSYYINSSDMNNLHREDGPAYEGVSGHKEWYLNGLLHREAGPAIEYADGSKYKEFLRMIKLMVFL